MTALAYIDPSAITSSTATTAKSGRHGDGSNHVSRLTLNVWTTLADNGGLKVLPKLLSMRRKGGFAVDADPLDRPGELHTIERNVRLTSGFRHPSLDIAIHVCVLFASAVLGGVKTASRTAIRQHER
jgi:hypothetical protein